MRVFQDLLDLQRFLGRAGARPGRWRGLAEAERLDAAVQARPPHGQQLGGPGLVALAQPQRQPDRRRFVRPEQQFPDPQSLKAQILRDVRRAQVYWRRVSESAALRLP